MTYHNGGNLSNPVSVSPPFFQPNKQKPNPTHTHPVGNNLDNGAVGSRFPRETTGNRPNVANLTNY